MSPHGVTVNVVAPGPIDTALLEKVPREKIDEVVSRQLITRQGEPEDVWNIVSMLLAQQSSMITGQTIYVGGA
jgi:3-oxoacyl-[acyl-carrier protein] reductase